MPLLAKAYSLSVIKLMRGQLLGKIKSDIVACVLHLASYIMPILKSDKYIGLLLMYHCDCIIYFIYIHVMATFKSFI